MITAFNLIIERLPNTDKKKKRKKLYKDTTKKLNKREKDVYLEISF